MKKDKKVAEKILPIRKCAKCGNRKKILADNMCNDCYSYWLVGLR